MNKHPLLRAYLAGICLPTIFLLVVATGFAALHERLHLSLGLFGGLLPLLLAPLGYLVGHVLEFPIPQYVLALAPIALCIMMILYYLVWKYLVSFLNAELGI